MLLKPLVRFRVRISEAFELVRVHHPKIQEGKEVEEEYRGDFFSGEVLSTLFGDDVPNGTPINFDEEDPRLP